MLPRNLLLLTLLTACGTATNASVDATDASDTSAGILTADATITGTTYADRCQSIATAICAGWQDCCTAISATCVADLNKLCLQPGKFSGLADAAIAGKLVLDPALSAQCDAAVAAVATNCGERNSSNVLVTCLYAWVDPAGIGEACADSRDESCANGQGRCRAVGSAVPGPSQPTCTKSLPLGAACPAANAECAWGAFCGSAMGKPVCIAEGALCGTFGDVVALCPDGEVCSKDATCVADSGAGRGAACTVATDCKRDHACTDGKCVPALCGELAGK